VAAHSHKYFAGVARYFHSAYIDIRNVLLASLSNLALIHVLIQLVKFGATPAQQKGIE
jgi:hypothetical protein